MDEEELSDAAIQGDLPRIQPEDGQSLRDCACGEDKVCSGQHAEEEVHGFVVVHQALLSMGFSRQEYWMLLLSPLLLLSRFSHVRLCATP